MPLPPSSHAAHCINPHCPRPYPQLWSDLQCPHCDTPLRLHNRYIPIQWLKQGHSIHLYLVYDPETNTEKIMRLLVAIAPKAKEIFEREVAALSNLHHRGLPKIEASAYFHITIRHPSAMSLPGVVMEKVEGSSLQDVITQYPQGCSEAWVINWFRQTVLILQKLHSRRLLHRDLKPSSLILRQGSPQIAIADFGFPKSMLSDESTQPLSGGYIPPEQVRGESIGPSADFYALGRICIHLLTGRHPLTLEDETGALQWRQRIRVQPTFANLLDRLVQKEMRLRLHTATDILDELNRTPTKAPSAPLPLPSPVSPPPSKSPGMPISSRSSGHPSGGASKGSTTSGSGKLVAMARTATRSKPKSYHSNSSGGAYIRGGNSSSGSRTKPRSTPSSSGRYRDDPHPQNLMSGRPEPKTFRTRMTSAIAVVEHAQDWLVQVSVVLFRAIVYACISAMLAAGVGFWVVYWSPLSPYFTAFFAHQLASPDVPLVVRPAMIVFAFAGVGTTWGLTQTQNLETQRLLWRRRALGGLVYAIAWLAWQWGTVGSAGVSGVMRCIVAIALGMVFVLGSRGNVLIQALVATVGTSLTFTSLMQSTVWQPGDLLYLFQTARNFIPTEAICVSAIAFFGLLGVVFSFWLGFSYYVGTPCLEQLGRFARRLFG
ncbi:MAG: protein kinase [Oculatellaceae cyanobacterium bins.114]|nr:protein kinase [Oculatellaceae cyanobacterium bins.114]